MQETLFIINPVSGRGVTSKTWQSVRRELVSAGISFNEHFTTAAGEAATVARAAIQSGVQQVIAVGGDGTLGELVNGYLDQTGRAINRDASLGILPSGTGSDFRRSIGLLSLNEAVRAIIDPKTRMIDAMRVTYREAEGREASRFAINVASFGLGGEVVHTVNGWRGKLPNWIGGRGRFVAGALLALGRYRNKSVCICLDQETSFEMQSNLLIAANGRFAGSGMMFAPHAELDDGLLDIILTNCTTRLDIIRELPRIFRGEHLKNPKVEERKARHLSITSPEKLAVDVDGEAVGFTPATVSILPSAIRFIC